MSMNPEIKAQWIAALRSGEYQQGRGYLNSHTEEGDKFCCLGVLCDLAVKAGVDVEVREHDFINGLSYNGGTSLLPNVVEEWAELPDRAVGLIVEIDGQALSLPMLNDGNRDGTETFIKVDPYTFEQIADVIEANL